ncbi:MAG: hypothetical protein U5J97_01165 [Trueperaceae bacterium]|nr:hypothetical protein [Trueperaceae bacterium]
MHHFETIYRIQSDRAEGLRDDAARARQLTAARGLRTGGLRATTARWLRDLAELLDPRPRAANARTT